MNIADYSTLKAANKASVSKVTLEDDSVEYKLTTKVYNSITGASEDDNVAQVSLENYEQEKVYLTAEKSRITAELAQLNVIITDIKAL